MFSSSFAFPRGNRPSVSRSQPIAWGSVIDVNPPVSFNLSTRHAIKDRLDGHDLNANEAPLSSVHWFATSAGTQLKQAVYATPDKSAVQFFPVFPLIPSPAYNSLLAAVQTFVFWLWSPKVPRKCTAPLGLWCSSPLHWWIQVNTVCIAFPSV